MATTVTVRMVEWEKLLPRSYQLVRDGWRLDVLAILWCVRQLVVLECDTQRELRGPWLAVRNF